MHAIFMGGLGVSLAAGGAGLSLAQAAAIPPLTLHIHSGLCSGHIALVISLWSYHSDHRKGEYRVGQRGQDMMAGTPAIRDGFLSCQ